MAAIRELLASDLDQTIEEIIKLDQRNEHAVYDTPEWQVVAGMQTRNRRAANRPTLSTPGCTESDNPQASLSGSTCRFGFR